MPNNAAYRFNGKEADRVLMFCPVGFKSAGTTAMLAAIGVWGVDTFEKGVEYSNNPPGMATHVFINIAVSAAEKVAILATDFGAVISYLQSDGWAEGSAADDLGLTQVTT